MDKHFPNDHPGLAKRKIGVLLLNLGTPDATDYWSMRRYLKEFLSDRRVIETPRLLWWPLLNGIILTTRPKRSGANYDKIWDKGANDSPLRVIAKSQAAKLQGAFGEDSRILVDFAMRYGNPSTGSRLKSMQEAGCDRILLVPLYPQYSAATTATANDKAFETLAKMRWQPAVRTVPSYHDEPAYISAIANSIRVGVAGAHTEPEVVLASYHGLPKTYHEKGDPYFCFCRKTTRLVAEELGWPAERLITTFQSRFGPAEWLQPYTEPTLAGMAAAGTKSVAVITPGFSVDCLETLEEIAIGARKTFLEAGGENFTFIECLNDGAGAMAVIKALVGRELSGWFPGFGEGGAGQS
jgi:protoporphyrin/coproporphyrin ferrochelatase